MAYEKQTWACGDTITADKLNHIEDGIADADKGYECTDTESRQTLTEESITKEIPSSAAYVSLNLSYNTLIDADTLVVTFNGAEYTCEKNVMNNFNIYGGVSPSGPDFSEYPFAIMSSSNGSAGTNVLFAETDGTSSIEDYSIKIEIEAVDVTVETTPCFEKAVKKVVSEIPSNDFKVTISGASTDELTVDRTFEEIKNAVNSGKRVYAVREAYGWITEILPNVCTSVGDTSGVVAEFTSLSYSVQMGVGKWWVHSYRIAQNGAVSYQGDPLTVN